MNELIESEEFKWCNHYHELTDNHSIIEIDGKRFVANREAVNVLKALNEVGLNTRTHHISNEQEWAFVSILLDDVEIEVKTVDEVDSSRTEFNGKKELLIKFKNRKYGK